MKFALCRKGLHEMTPNNRGRQMARSGNVCNYCRQCRRDWKNAKRRQAKGGVLLDGATRGQRISMARKAAWVRQREAGYVQPPSVVDKRQQHARGRTWCRRMLHRWTPENLLDNGRRKTCKWCAKATDLARAERRRSTDVTTALWLARIAAHPDKGGTDDAFDAANKAWKQHQESV